MADSHKRVLGGRLRCESPGGQIVRQFDAHRGSALGIRRDGRFPQCRFRELGAQAFVSASSAFALSRGLLKQVPARQRDGSIHGQATFSIEGLQDVRRCAPNHGLDGQIDHLDGELCLDWLALVVGGRDLKLRHVPGLIVPAAVRRDLDSELTLGCGNGEHYHADAKTRIGGIAIGSVHQHERHKYVGGVLGFDGHA